MRCLSKSTRRSTANGSDFYAVRTRSILRLALDDCHHRFPWQEASLQCLASFPMPRGSAPGLSRRGRGSCSTPQCSERPLVEVPWPGRPSTEDRNISAGPPISGAVVSLQSARTYIPQPICVRLRVPDYSEDNTSVPTVLLASSCGQKKILSPTLNHRKYAEGFPRDRT